MRIDSHLLSISATICKDLAVAFFIAAIVTQQFFSTQPVNDVALALTKNVVNGILFMYLSWQLTKGYEQIMSGNELFNILNSAPTFGVLLAIFFAIILLAARKDTAPKSPKSSKR